MIRHVERQDSQIGNFKVILSQKYTIRYEYASPGNACTVQVVPNKWIPTFNH